MKAIVLVGGEGTRLRPLTESTPKPALMLVDRPFLAHFLEWLARHGVEEAVLACGFLPDVLAAALGDGERAGMRIRYVAEPEPRGTAGAIRFAADELGDQLGDTFLALNGDVLTDLDLGQLVAAHRAPAAPATIGLHRVDDSSAYGLVETGAEGEVASFREKTGDEVPGEINAGIYVLERTVLERIAPGRPCSIEREVFPEMVGDGLHARRLDGYWMDIGTPRRYLQASWDILEGRVETLVRPTAPGSFVDPGARVAGDARIGPRAVVGPACAVGAAAVVEGSVLLEGCSIGQGARVSGSILGPGVVVTAGATVVDDVLAGNQSVPA